MFSGAGLADVRVVIRKALRMLRRWSYLCKEYEGLQLEEFVQKLELKSRQALQIGWTMPDSLAAPVHRW